MSANNQTLPIAKGAGFFRRLGAWFYDALILISVEMLAITIALGLIYALTLLGLSQEGYADISDLLVNHPIIGPVFTFYVFSVIAAFYSYFWCEAGQTVGMRAWKLKIVDVSGGQIKPTQALIRLATACLGLGNLLVPFDRNNRAFQDHFAKCQIVKID